MSDGHDNVIILGAGFSATAGIPVMKDFIERMVDYHDGKLQPELSYHPIGENDKETLKAALDICDELDGYHGRISFNAENIEDILSLLAYSALVDGADVGDFKKFINAISTTIELSYRAPHQNICEQMGWDSRFQSQYHEHMRPYQEFWENLFRWCRNDPSRKMPTIISFNYDLILERSLIHTLMGYRDLPRKSIFGDDGFFPFDSVTLDYEVDDFFPREHYNTNNYDSHIPRRKIIGRIGALEKLEHSIGKGITINILKLHGSLNYPNKKSELFEEEPSVIRPVKHPYIIPPISNKSYDDVRPAWELAMKRLRKAKNVIFVGYSLPKTDVHMPFFLKAALGPNRNLKKIYVFDPVLWNENNNDDAEEIRAEEMRNRYKDCFSPQYVPKIHFHPTDEVIERKSRADEHERSESGIPEEFDYDPNDPYGHESAAARAPVIEKGSMEHFVVALGDWDPDFNILY